MSHSFYAPMPSKVDGPKSRTTSGTESAFQNILAPADIMIGGKRPWDIQVHNKKFFPRVMAEGTIGLGESYMDKWWDCAALDEMFFRAIRAQLDQRMPLNVEAIVASIAALIFNFQNKRRSQCVAKQHYDLGNDFFRAMLDPFMQYSCAYFQNVTSLDEAQKLKMDLICRKLQLRAGMRLLDVGCGWGGLAKYAAQNYGCHVVGITISKEQYDHAKNACQDLPVEIRLQDYRDLTEPFDRIVSVGMLEHVGYKNYRTYMKTVSRCLLDDGLFLCHTIGSNQSNTHPDAWITKYIFPNSMLPSISQVARATEGLFIIEDIHNFGADYDHTLLAWEENFREAWEHFKSDYGERFYRMWRFYLLSCAGAFRARSMQLFQFLFSKGGTHGGYVSVR